MLINFNRDMEEWLDQNRKGLSRSAFIVSIIRNLMSDTMHNDAIHTNGVNNEKQNNHIYGASDAPKQN